MYRGTYLVLQHVVRSEFIGFRFILSFVSIESRRNFLYQGQQCRTDENCVIYSRCDISSKSCTCDDGYTGLNGLCCKYRLNKMFDNDSRSEN
jgi:EB module